MVERGMMRYKHHVWVEQQIAGQCHVILNGRSILHHCVGDPVHGTGRVMDRYARIDQARVTPQFVELLVDFKPCDFAHSVFFGESGGFHVSEDESVSHD